MGRHTPLKGRRVSVPPGGLPVALACPQPARVALSSLGWQTAARSLTQASAAAVEPAYFEGPDQPPVGAASGRPLGDFPLIAFSLTCESDYVDALSMLARAGIPWRAADRPRGPVLFAGGPLCFLNPAPFAEVMDFFWIGESEAGLTEVFAELVRLLPRVGDKDELFADLAHAPGVYAPGRTATPVARVFADRDWLAEHPAHSMEVSSEAVFKDMFLMEINRGCPSGCRFCAAGYIYRPPRRAGFSALTRLLDEHAPKKVGLVGTALTDWPELPAFLDELTARRIKYGLGSLRADGLTDDLLKRIRASGARTLTVALEAASERLRRASNKRLTAKGFLKAAEAAARHAFDHLKVYLIYGWPGETDADYQELSELCAELAQAGRLGTKRGLTHATLSVSSLVPKPFTPLQWAPMAPKRELEERLKAMRAMARPIKGFKVEGDSPFAARCQGLVARGGPEIFPFLAQVSSSGGNWRAALEDFGELEADILDRERGRHEAFPWEVVDCGVSREHLWSQWERYQSAQHSAPCPQIPCEDCMACRP